MNKDILFEPFEKQKAFIEKCFDSRYRVLLYGGSIRGGKTFCTLALIILLCKIYPKSRWAVVRKDSMTIRRNTLPSFWKILPQQFMKSFNATLNTAYMNNGSEILFLGENFDKDKELNRFRGLEVNGFVLEEANELNESTYNKAIERSGSNLINPMPKPLIALTCNPSQGYLKTKFYDPWKSGTLEAPFFYMPASIFDNPKIPKEYLESLKSLPPEIYRRFVEGDWEGSDDPNQLVPWEDLYKAQDMILDVDESFSLGADIAGHGPDKSVFIVMKGYNIEKIEVYGDTSVQQCYHKIMDLSLRYGINSNRICVDGSGLGSGVVDLLKGQEKYVVNFIGGSSPLSDTTSYSYKNLRSQAFWWLRECFVNREIGNITEEILKSDIASIWYYVDNDRTIKIESKDDCKKRIGRSPDYADALCYAWWARIHDRMGKMPGIFIF